MPKLRADDDSCRIRDDTLRPLTEVHYRGREPGHPAQRLIRLPPREAVAWCVASHVLPPYNWQHMVQYVKLEDNVWMLGDYYARPTTRSPF
jgi:hypothetical protein